MGDAGHQQVTCSRSFSWTPCGLWYQTEAPSATFQGGVHVASYLSVAGQRPAQLQKSHVSSLNRPAVLQLHGCMSSTGATDQRSAQTSAADGLHESCRCRMLLFVRNRGQRLPLPARRENLGA